MRTSILPLGLVVVLLAFSVSILATAEATPPGTNGRIIFTSERDGDGEIFSMNADGTNQIRLTKNGADDARPSGSPDGSKIVFHSNRTGNNEIFIMNADGSNETRLTNSPGFDGFPVISPDGQVVAFHSNRDGDNEIFTMNMDGTGLFQVTNNTFDDQEATWHPSGQGIGHSSTANGNLDIFEIGPDGNGLFQLTSDPSQEFSPDFLPNGEGFLYSSNALGGNNFEGFAIYDISNPAAPVNITDRVEPDSELRSSPDGMIGVWEGQAGNGVFQIHSRPLAGGPLMQLTSGDKRNGEPYWMNVSTTSSSPPPSSGSPSSPPPSSPPPGATCEYSHIPESNTLFVRVTGTDEAERIELRLTSDGSGMVECVIGGEVRLTFDPTEVDAINIKAGGGDDTIIIRDGIDLRVNISGGDGNDSIKLGDGPVDAEGGGGSDSIVDDIDEVLVICRTRQSCDANKDSFDGGSGNDRIVGGGGVDVITGGIGDDELQGGKHGDTLKGEGGSDELDGQGGTDRLDGGPGSDLLSGGGGSDELTGGSGGGDTCNGGAGQDRILVGGRTGCEKYS